MSEPGPPLPAEMMESLLQKYGVFDERGLSDEFVSFLDRSGYDLTFGTDKMILSKVILSLQKWFKNVNYKPSKNVFINLCLYLNMTLSIARTIIDNPTMDRKAVGDEFMRKVDIMVGELNKPERKTEIFRPEMLMHNIYIPERVVDYLFIIKPVKKGWVGVEADTEKQQLIIHKTEFIGYSPSDLPSPDSYVFSPTAGMSLIPEDERRRMRREYLTNPPSYDKMISTFFWCIEWYCSVFFEHGNWWLVLPKDLFNVLDFNPNRKVFVEYLEYTNPSNKDMIWKTVVIGHRRDEFGGDGEWVKWMGSRSDKSKRKKRSEKLNVEER